MAERDRRNNFRAQAEANEERNSKKASKFAKREQKRKRNEQKQRGEAIRETLREHFHGNAEWKRELELFAEKLKPEELTIKDVAGDGNCLFRAIADQLEDNPENFNYYRQKICDYMRDNRFDFEFFVEDDEPFEDYIHRMRTAGEWGGEAEIHAASEFFLCNVRVYRLEDGDYEINNFPPDLGVKNLLLSYHNGEHYCSVRQKNSSSRLVVPIEGLDAMSLNATHNEVIVVKTNSNSTKQESLPGPTEQEREIMSITGCFNQKFVHYLLLDNNYDSEAVVNFILTVGYEEDFQKLYLKEKMESLGIYESERESTISVQISHTSVPKESYGPMYMQKEKMTGKKGGYNKK